MSQVTNYTSPRGFGSCTWAKPQIYAKMDKNQHFFSFGLRNTFFLRPTPIFTAQMDYFEAQRCHYVLK